MKLYKKDSKGKIRVLEITTDDNLVVQKSGLLDGKLTTNIRECSPKNIGKVNETTAEQQAITQAKSIINKKLKEGYFKTIEEAKAYVNLMPMLAKPIDLSKLSYPVYVQPKLDGIRMIATNKSKLSRKNRKIDTVDHIDLSSIPDDAILDGELYIHNKSFQEITSLVKRKQYGTEYVIYNVYDLPSHKGTFKERYDKLLEVVGHLSNVEVVSTILVNSEDELKEYHNRFINDGYEGTIVRTNDTEYEFNKRSSSLLKYKDFFDEACKIIDVVPNEAIPTQGTIVCELNGKTFKCNMKMSHVERELILITKDEYIGKTAEVRFFEYTDDGVPRFPVFCGVRLDK